MRTYVIMGLWLMAAAYGVIAIIEPSIESKLELLMSFVFAGFVETLWKESE